MTKNNVSVFNPRGEERHAYGSGRWDRMWLRPNPDLRVWDDVAKYALTIDGYAYAIRRWGEQHGDQKIAAMIDRLQQHVLPDADFETLRYLLFKWQRMMRWSDYPGPGEDQESTDGLRLHQAICAAWNREHAQHPDEVRLAYVEDKGDAGSGG